jgi:hypothetical protein
LDATADIRALRRTKVPGGLLSTDLSSIIMNVNGPKSLDCASLALHQYRDS